LLLAADLAISRNVFGSLKITEGTTSTYKKYFSERYIAEKSGQGELTWMNHSFQVLRSVEVLLLLEEMNIRNNWHASYRLTMRWIGKGNALITREVRGVVLSLSRALHTRQLCGRFGRTIVRSLK
jgi:hypothetical protein